MPLPLIPLPFPFNIRATMRIWNALYFKEGPYQPNPANPLSGTAAFFSSMDWRIAAPVILQRRSSAATDDRNTCKVLTCRVGRLLT